MAKKQGISITQGADSAIVAAATAAGKAGSPPSYVATFEQAAVDYAKTMEASAKMWDQVAQAVSTIGVAATKAAQHDQELKKQGVSAQNLEGQSVLLEEFDGIKSELKQLGAFGGMFGDKEKRTKRLELLAQKDAKIAEIQSYAASIDDASKLAAAEKLDYNLMGMHGSEIFTAIVASNTPNKVTEKGNVALIERDEKSNELVYKMYKQGEDGSRTPVLDDVTKEHVSMSLPQFKKLTTEAVIDEKGQIPTAMNTIMSGMEQTALKQGGTYDDYQKGKFKNALKPLMVKPNGMINEIGLKRLFRASFGQSGSSFYEELTSASPLSASLYTALGEVVGKTNKGQLAQQGPLADVPDTDGTKGISKKELEDYRSSTNYMALSGSILGLKDSKVSKQVFEAWADTKAEQSYNFGLKLRQRSKGEQGLQPYLNVQYPGDIKSISKEIGISFTNRLKNKEKLVKSPIDGMEYELLSDGRYKSIEKERIVDPKTGKVKLEHKFYSSAAKFMFDTQMDSYFPEIYKMLLGFEGVTDIDTDYKLFDPNQFKQEETKPENPEQAKFIFNRFNMPR